MSNPIKIAVIGLGEVSGQLAHNLKSAGADVVGFDQVKPKFPPVPLAQSLEEAVDDADIVLTLTSSLASLRTAETVAKTLKPGAIYADLNSGTPSLKRKLGGLLPSGSFADVAVMNEELAVSGQAAERLVETLGAFGMSLEFVSDSPGDAAARKLVRLLLDKGIASVLADTLWAAKSLGMEDWAITEIRELLGGASETTVQNYLDDTGKHGKQYSVAMGDVSEMLAEAGHESTTINGISLTMSHIMHGRRIPFADLSGD